MGFFSKLFKLIAIVIAIIAIVFLIVAAMVAIGAGAFVPQVLLFAGAASAFPYIGAALILGVISAMVSEEGFNEVVSGVGDAVTTVTSAVGGVVGDGVGGLVSGVFSSVNPLWIGGGLLAWYVLSDSGKKEKRVAKRDRNEDVQYIDDRRGVRV